MGRRYPYLWRQHSYIQLEESGDPGCVWGILKLINYHHHWRSVKKILPYKKNGTKTRSKNKKDLEKQKESDLLKGANEDGHTINEGNPIPIELVNLPETGSISKRSIKVRIKELMMAKDKNSKCRISYLPEQSELQKTQIDCTLNDNDGGKVDSSSKDKSAEDADILEIFKVNKHMFLEMLNDHNLNIGRLTKSGSFPSVNSTHMREWGPSKLEDKQREVWPLTKSMPLLHENDGDGSQVITSKGKLKSMRRASSLTESMDRYSQLFGSASGFNKDIKRNLSRSLKMVMNENDEQPQKFGRRLSLPECDYESLLPNLEASKEAVNSGPESINEKGNHFESAGEHCEDAMNKAINEEINGINQGECMCQVAVEFGQDLNPDSPYKEEQVGAIKLPVSEDYEAPRTDQVLPSKLVDEKQNQEFNYVKVVLELSGFTAKDQTWVWYTIEHPLNPTIFKEIEKEYYPLEQKEEHKWGRKLIFDLINEALVEIDERSYLYCPRALSSNCHVHPIPKGQRLLEEVWVFVGQCLSWRPELDPTLDLAVAQDLLLGRNGWMNLQIESECVALELEEMILDEFIALSNFGIDNLKGGILLVHSFLLRLHHEYNRKKQSLSHRWRNKGEVEKGSSTSLRKQAHEIFTFLKFTATDQGNVLSTAYNIRAASFISKFEDKNF
ncbi:hypothetical protein V2J09_018185 [Rumex salicifolius]